MKTALVFLALLLGTVLNISAKEITSKDTVNNWYFWKATGSGIDTAYTHLTTKSYEGTSAQIFGSSTRNHEDSFYWRKELNNSYLSPKFILAKVSLDSIGLDSINGADIDFFVGNKKNPNVIYRMSGTGTNGYFLSHPEWFSRPYWLDVGASRMDSSVTELDSINFVVIRITYSWGNKDPKSEWIVDNLKLAYGKGNPWEDPTIDSTIIIDRFGDSDPIIVKPKLSFAPQSADFGTLKVSEISYKDTLIIFRNTGTDTLRGNISVTEKEFSIDDANLLITPMDSVTKTVRFALPRIGKISGLLIIESNDPFSPDTVFLTGFGEGSTGVNDNPELPKIFSLSQNYPNPFNPSTTIEFSLPKRAYVNLSIYNILGQKVETLVNREMESDMHHVIWNAGNMPSGTYFYQIETSIGFKAVKKMLLVK